MALLERLDFIYHPSRDVAADVEWFTGVLGAELVFAIDGMGTRVAMLELGTPPPHLLLAGHLHGETPVLVYRVAEIAEAMRELETRGWTPESTFEIPHGPLGEGGNPSAGARQHPQQPVLVLVRSAARDALQGDHP